MGGGQFDRGQFLAAVPDFEKAAQLQPRNLYHVIGLYLAQSRGGQNGRDNLVNNISRLNLNHWPGRVIAMYLETTPSQAVLDAALDTDARKQRVQQCEGYFYVGEYFLIQGKKEDAVRMFRAAIDTDVSSFAYYHSAYLSAKAELERMGY